MSIFYDEKSQIFKLDTSGSSYILHIYEGGYLLNLYYGKKIPDYNLKTFTMRTANASFSASNPDLKDNGFSPDTAPMEYGTNGAGDFRISAVSVENSNGDSVTDLRYHSHRIYGGKPEIKGLPSTYATENEPAETLEIEMVDSVTGLVVILVYTVFENIPVITKSVRAANNGKEKIKIERIFSTCNDFPSMDFDMISLCGRYALERMVQRKPLSGGLQGVESKRGVSGHVHNPFVALARHDATEETGEVFGFNLVYSGNFSALVECDINHSSRLILGINPTDFEWNLNPDEIFYAPEAVLVYSDKGIGEMSRVFHRFYNEHLIRGIYKNSKRPILINSWEAAYFDFDTEKLVSFAETASKLGIEMLVMDDGWFGKRNRDNCSLGDWYVNEEKLPGGLAPLIERVNSLGMKFGIWYEPEMISPDSDLFRAHPDWCVHVDGRNPMIGRNQYVLDVSRKDVRDNIFNQMKKVLDNNKIDYVKWDFNRNITDAGSAILPKEQKKEFFHRFILGTYDLMNRFITEYPHILFENCSGGGGRFDPGMLAYSPQIWTSDNTDAIARLSIQFGTSMCYPASCMGAHVSAHSRTGFNTRGNVALWGTFGYEIDPRTFSEEQKQDVLRQVEDYHRYYDLIHYGDLYRLINPYDKSGKAAWSFVSSDKNECLTTVVCMHSFINEYFVLKFSGLDPDKVYCNTLDNECYSGALLMNAGINLSGKVNGDGESISIYLKSV